MLQQIFKLLDAEAVTADGYNSHNVIDGQIFSYLLLVHGPMIVIILTIFITVIILIIDNGYDTHHPHHTYTLQLL